ncbi:TPA: conjugal transfer protein TraW [Salmonella enterica subsp. salamae serovar 35:g,m,s,t:-]|nr:conjugal transfer protein TraW [Salmonella enterica subsp. salamae serovar 35:g,m,s,t:-]HCA3549731.1 conjugal transfer protein TraW [Salmonella enterica subsp. salamae serovar 35:g,m,s,t:-]
MLRTTKLAASIMLAFCLTPYAYAFENVSDSTTHQLLSEILSEIGSASAATDSILTDIGTTINEGNGKIANTVQASAEAQRQMNIEQERTSRDQDARIAYEIPENICSESGSGGASEVAGAAAAAQTKLRPGGGGTIANSKVAKIIQHAALAPEADANSVALVHAQYCDSDDYAAYGGSDACPSVNSSMPGADKRVDSVLTGAGKDGKTPDLTFNQAQTDAAMMYTQNSVRRSIAPQLTKKEAETPLGLEYVGLMNQYNSELSAAAAPQEQSIADRQTVDSTQQLLKEALVSPSAQSFYNETASTQAKSTGKMSFAEFEQFEVGRRYANTDYNNDLQAMTSDNLLREQIRVSALQNWLLLELKRDVEKGNIIAGEQLASAAKTEYQPLLQEKLHAVKSAVAGD